MTVTRPIWLTPAGSLGVLAEGVFFQLLLDAYNPGGGAITYTVISGSLPPGMQLINTGTLQGVPVVTNVATGQTGYLYTFSIRATNKDGVIADRGFEATVTSLIPPKILPPSESLGQFYDSTLINIQLSTTEINPEANLTWEIYSGELPVGLTLTQTGLITGYATLALIPPAAGYGGWNTTTWNTYDWDFTSTATIQNKNYQFTVRVSDGVNFDLETYTMYIVSKQILTGDNTVDTVDMTTLTVDTDNKHTPIITTPTGFIPTTRQNSYYAFQFQGLDFDGDTLNYAISVSKSGAFDTAGVGFDDGYFDEDTTTLPPGLVLDPVTGWLTGQLGPQTADQTTYTFTVYCYKVNNPSYVSEAVLFELVVLGDINNTITWVTSSNLGTIDNGAISMLALQATSPTGHPITYSLTEGSPSRLPQGLELLPDGLISGRVTFEFFSLDKTTTTIDGGKTNFDNNYYFTVTANTATVSGNSYITSQKTFSVSVNDKDIRPYENLYLKAFPLLDQRDTFASIISNTELFPPALIYRANDPWFGVAKDISFLFLPGLHPATASQYIAAMQNNYYTKRIQLSDIKTAVALDQFYNVIYEVVYVDVNDSSNYTNITGTIAQQTNLAGLNANPYIDENGNIHNVFYPNDFNNMRQDVVNGITFQDEGALPLWMKTPQTDGTVLGFTKALVLAYTVPGASKLIAYRLASNGITFNNLDFTIDRFILDNEMTQNYDIVNDKFITSAETTFDASLNNPLTHGVRTKFDGDGTRFFNNRDVYAAPFVNNQYLKFPKTGVFK